MTLLSKTFCKKHLLQGAASLDQKYDIEIFDSINGVEEAWSVISSAHDIFYSAEFLRCVETYPASGIKPYYSIVKDSDNSVGIIYFQSKSVKLRENLRYHKADQNSTMSLLAHPIKQAVVNAINFETIVCGNLLLTGKYGFYFKDTVPRDDQFNIVRKAIDKLIDYLNTLNIKPGLVLVKDFFSQDIPVKAEHQADYTKFTVQPKMILNLDPNWKTFDDYLEDMKSKYRVRARKAMQKATNIKKVVFQEEDIATHRKVIHTLYKNVSDQADFNAFVLHEQYFENLKAALGDKMTFTTYWVDDKMVAFFTSIKNYDVLDAHFLGYDPVYLQENQLYLNMLYDLVREGIDKKVAQIDMSRTAVEIKSTVGAIPYDMFLYLKHTNAMLNKTVDFVLGLVKPEEQYVIRSPFRDE